MDYKKTLEDIVKIINTTEKCDDGFVNICNYIYENCPELSESEDEKIRKEIISALKYANHKGIYDKHIAWLEKQGKLDNNDTDILNRFSFYSYKDEPNVIYLSELYVNKEHRNKGIGTKILEIADKVAASMGCNFIRLKTEIDSNAERLYKRNGYKTLNREGNQVWLEKQNEQKYSIKVKPKFKIGDKVTNGYYTCKIEGIDDTTYYCSDSSFISRFDIKEQDRFELVDQETDFKPKFQEGDWIVNNNCGGVYQVTEIRDDEYCLWPLDAEIMGYSKIIDVDDYYHLWTIQDAKDGDILSNGIMIVIFKRLEELAYRGHIVAYIGLDSIGNIQVTDGTWKLGIDKAHPATKEQRDLLFKRMKETGYEWDANKKEPKKIYPKFNVNDWV